MLWFIPVGSLLIAVFCVAKISRIWHQIDTIGRVIWGVTFLLWMVSFVFLTGHLILTTFGH